MTDSRMAMIFPFLLGGAFIEANKSTNNPQNVNEFPFLFWRGAFIEVHR